MKPKKKVTKKLKILRPKEKEASNNSTIEALTHDEKVALEVYEALKSKRADNIDSDEEDEVTKEEVQAMEEGPTETHSEDFEEERRAITYQIAKNKGLQPKRNKLQRNPRVKHRHKFEKAKVRRKGQVRDVRKETKKYGGEASGINMRVKKGVKLS